MINRISQTAHGPLRRAVHAQRLPRHDAGRDGMHQSGYGSSITVVGLRYSYGTVVPVTGAIYSFTAVR